MPVDCTGYKGKSSRNNIIMQAYHYKATSFKRPGSVALHPLSGPLCRTRQSISRLLDPRGYDIGPRGSREYQRLFGRMVY